MSSGLNRHTHQLVTTAREDRMNSRREDSDASSLAAHLEEDEREDEDGLKETGDTSTTTWTLIRQNRGQVKAAFDVLAIAVREA